MLKENMIIFI
jgi:hypothetical protein